MTTGKDIVARLRWWGEDGVVGDRAMLAEAAAHIEALEARLAARDGEIAAWLDHTIKSTKLDVADGLWGGISEDAESFISTLRIIKDGIKARAYAKEIGGE